MTICIAGKNKIAVQSLIYLIENTSNNRIVACVNSNDDGINAWQPSFKFYCNRYNIPILKLDELYEIEDLIFISLEFDKIIKPEKFKSIDLFNIHFSKLPAYKGMFTSVMPLLNGEVESGVTLHKIDSGIDTGEIIDQIVFSLNVELNSRELYDKYLDNAFFLFKKNIESLISGKYRFEPQPSYGASYYSKKQLDFSNIVVDFQKTAFEIHNQIRAFAFRDYQLPVVFGHKIYKSVITNVRSKAKPGSIVHEDKAYFTISTIDYDIKLFCDYEQDLFEAAEKGDIKKIVELQSIGYPINIRTKKGWDILIVACYFNKYELVNYLINIGWDVNTSNYKGTTALMYAMTAASEGRGMESMKILFPFSNHNLTDDFGRNVFDYALQYNAPDVLSFLKI